METVKTKFGLTNALNEILAIWPGFNAVITRRVGERDYIVGREYINERGVIRFNVFNRIVVTSDYGESQATVSYVEIRVRRLKSGVFFFDITGFRAHPDQCDGKVEFMLTGTSNGLVEYFNDGSLFTFKAE
jgi:hypothetical protein